LEGGEFRIKLRPSEERELACEIEFRSHLELTLPQLSLHDTFISPIATHLITRSRLVERER